MQLEIVGGQEVFDPEDDLADVVRAQLVLVLDAEDQLLGLVADAHAEVLVPLRAQVVVNHLQTKRRRVKLR